MVELIMCLCGFTTGVIIGLPIMMCLINYVLE